VSNNNNGCNLTFKLLANIYFHVQFVPFVDREINILLALNKNFSFSFVSDIDYDVTLLLTKVPKENKKQDV
jgi:hypothetical protein